MSHINYISVEVSVKFPLGYGWDYGSGWGRRAVSLEWGQEQGSQA